MAQDTPTVMETIPTEFDYYESNPIQAAVLDEFDQYFIAPPIQDHSPIEFEIPKTNNLYVDLNNSKLEIRCKLLTAAGGDVVNDVAVGPVNLPLHSLFKSVDMQLCDKQITSTDTLYPYRSYMETFLSFAQDVWKTRLLTEGWISDCPTQYDDFRITDAGQNAGFKERRLVFRGSRIVTLIGRPHVDLFHQKLDIPPGCKIQLKFYPNSNDFVLKKPAANADGFRIKILSAVLWVRTKIVSDSFMLAQEMMLRKHNIRLPFTMVELKTATIGQGLMSIELDNIFSGTMPERVVVGLVANSRLNGHPNETP